MTSTGKRLNDWQHLRLRPDMYVGSTKTIDKVMRVYDEESCQLVLREIKYNPGLTRIIIEILSNAIDNKWASEKAGVPMKKISIEIDKETGEIIVENDGIHIPIEKKNYEYDDPVTGRTTKSELYPAELFFGYMKSGSNYDDDDKKVSSGRNGIGAKGTNGLSTEFTIEHTDPEAGKKFIQTFKNGAKERSTPKITSCKAKNAYTRITFTPDYKYFGFEINQDFVDLIHKLAIDAAMITGCNVSFNGGKIVCKDLTKYVKMSFPKSKMISFKTDKGDECVLVENETEYTDSRDVDQVSFVNGISTADGGVHVNAWRDAIFAPLVKAFNLRKSKDPVKTSAKELYPHFTLFVRCEIDWVKPSFDSQTKDCLNGPVPKVVKPTEEEIAKILKWNFVSIVDEHLRYKQDKTNAKKEDIKGNRKVAMGRKGQHANWAGTKKANECTMFITEGGSARAFVVAGISKVDNGTNKFGAFAIQGKFLNTSKKQVTEDNEEVSQLVGALGLQGNATKKFPKGSIDYSLDENFKKLMYQNKINFLTDPDDDGFHIRGLLINFFRGQYPTLWERNYFEFMSVPVVKIFKSPSAKNAELVFYSMPEFKRWMSSSKNKGMMVKYYKGLGTLKYSDAKDEFTNPKIVNIILKGDDDNLLRMAFGGDKGCSDERKDWMIKSLPTLQSVKDYIKEKKRSAIETSKQVDNYVYEGKYSISDFIQNQLLLYSVMTLSRAIPSMYDGFKEGQRKILYGMIKKNIVKERVIEKLAGLISDDIEYHHAPKALQDTITKMVQGFVGSNNLPLLQCCSQIGTRLEGGEDAPAPRYSETCLDPIVKFIFNPLDNPILTYVIDGKNTVEPEFYIPLFPMSLVNGGYGVATGWSTDVPMFNPEDVIKWIENKLDDKENTSRLIPYYRGFTGEIIPSYNADGIIENFKTKGKLTKQSDGWWHISEAPVGLWTYNLTEYIELKLMGREKPQTKRKVEKKTVKKEVKKDAKKEVRVTAMNLYNTTNKVSIKIKPHKDFTPNMNEKGNFDVLISNHSMKNMVLLNEKGYPIKFKSAEEILERFYEYRLHMYGERKKYWHKEYAMQLKIINNKIKYITGISEGKLKLNINDDVLDETLLKYGLEKICVTDEEANAATFNYLLSMQTKSLTKTRIQELKNEQAKIQTEHDYYANTSSDKIWKDDLAKFKIEYVKYLKRRNESDEM